MSSEIEAAGALATAGLAAGAIEKGAAGKHMGHAHACANCAAPLAADDKFCAACGQAAHVHRTLGHFIEEAFHGLFHFDAKAWRTLPLLVFRPGTLTRDYVHGRRARYISPLALFLFTVFLMFFVFALVGEVNVGERTPRTMAQLQAAVTAAEADVREAEADIATAQKELAALDAPGRQEEPGERGGLQGELAGAEGALTGAKAALASAQADVKRREALVEKFKKARAQLDINEAKEKAANNQEELNSIATSKGILDRALAAPGGPPDSIQVTVAETGEVNVAVASSEESGMSAIFEEIKQSNAEGRINVNTGNKKMDEKIRHKLDNPELAWYKIQNTAYKFSFLLVPISLPFIWAMFFWKRGVTLFDHTVFALYSLSFMSLIFVVFALTARAPPSTLEPLLAGFATMISFGIPLHIFFQIKGAYNLSWFSAAWRTVFMLGFAAFSLALFLALIFVLGLLG